MRLDRLLAQASISRKSMKRALLRGAILIDQTPARSLSQNVDTGLQEILFDKQKVPAPAHRYFMMNKPRGYITANSDASKETVIDLIQKEDYSGELYSIGRLDRDTTGLLLITDNGPLGFQLLHPQYHVDKTYYVQVNGLLNNQAIEAFQQGVRFLDGKVCKPAQLTIHSTTPVLSTASITISGGKFHQVKKMFLAIGVKVTYLKRTHFGDFQLDPSLAEGDYRSLNQDELKLIKNYLELSR
ncbi:16S rRNA pseudouridine(516) synthase [Streptococcus gordonii]|uniref:16S rRNA pseudouridine(516) synthase n=1 Tax=Streptococcus gordonii TaxID=1302 RepID=UPI00077979B3|nr:pseudouridine synthase [Streptococcus gordonii]MBZ2139458.1 rRNA pseudouridine synthase [Streptococcus gordonii]RSJ55406.1 Ribosomal small subunit pseudouridine synthase A [Streptococcus gordonii]